MTTAHYGVGESFALQFAWHLPEGDYIRAVFKAEVLDLVPQADKYIVLLRSLEAGRQEDEDGRMRPTDQYAREYWAMVANLVGRRITIAYEADDSRALHLRLATLTGEHNFFTRYADAEVIARGIMAAEKRKEEMDSTKETGADD